MAAQVAPNAIVWENLGLDPVALDLGFFELRWYSLAYLAGIFIGYWYLLKLLKQPGAPMARRHADDLVFYVPVRTVNRDHNFLGLGYFDGKRILAVCPQPKWGPRVPPSAF